MEFLSKSIIKINENSFIYRGQEFNNFEFLEKAKYIRNAVILILGYNIYIRKFKIDLKTIDETQINKIKEDEFGRDEEYLIHYEICKKEKELYMYAIGGGKKVSYIADSAKGLRKLKVVPIQMYVREFLKKKIKDKDYQCLYLYLGVYYYISIHNGYIVKCCIWKDIREAEDFFNKINNRKILYAQHGIEIKNDNVVFVNFGGLYNEKIFIK